MDWCLCNFIFWNVLLRKDDLDKDKIFELIVDTIQNLVKDNNISSAHINFITSDISKKLNKKNWIQELIFNSIGTIMIINHLMIFWIN